MLRDYVSIFFSLVYIPSFFAVLGLLFSVAVVLGLLFLFFNVGLLFWFLFKKEKAELENRKKPDGWIDVAEKELKKSKRF